MLLVLSGLPGTGKTTLARALIRRFPAPYLRIDTIEAALKNAGHSVTVEGYAVGYALAADQLSMGLSVIADCVNPVSETRTAWEEVARQAGVRLINVEVSCSDPVEHQRRVMTRFQDPANHVGIWSPPDWEALEIYSRTYQPWEREVVQVDTAHCRPETVADDLLQLIKGNSEL